MGRLITGAVNPVVLYVSGGNTQVSVKMFKYFYYHWMMYVYLNHV